MRKFLSIVIPRYKETEKEIFPLLSSINGQLGIDFSDIEVIISNDGSGEELLDQDFLSLFRFDIRNVCLDINAGPGVARQAGFDAAIGDYVMFCDADDTLHSVGVLGTMIQETEKTASDILTTEWLEELLYEDGGCNYIKHAVENTWMHGKLFRRQFLIQNGIRFHKKLRVHEDSYFLCIASAAAERQNHISITSYVWKFHPNSITRRNGAVYTYESIPTFIEAMSMAYKKVESIKPELMEYKILQFTLYNYFCFHQPGWQMPEHAHFLEAAEKAFVSYISPFWRYWQEASPQTISNIYNQERAKSFVGCIESETLWDWIQRIGVGK